MSSNYDDIIHLPHKQSITRSHMPIIDRAAQFAPFAALTGYDSAISETGRLTDEKRELIEEQKQELNSKINFIANPIAGKNEVIITYFLEDTKKSGGTYISHNGIVKKIDPYEGMIIYEDDTKIFIDDIVEIECPTLSKLEEY